MPKYVDKTEIIFSDDDSSASKAGKDLGKAITDGATPVIKEGLEKATANIGDKVAKSVRKALKDVSKVELEADTTKVINSVNRLKDIIKSISEIKVSPDDSSSNLKRNIALHREELSLRKDIYELTQNKYQKSFQNQADIKKVWNFDGFDFKNTLKEIQLAESAFEKLEATLAKPVTESTESRLDNIFNNFKNKVEAIEKASEEQVRLAKELEKIKSTSDWQVKTSDGKHIASSQVDGVTEEIGRYEESHEKISALVAMLNGDFDALHQVIQTGKVTVDEFEHVFDEVENRVGGFGRNLQFQSLTDALFQGTIPIESVRPIIKDIANDLDLLADANERVKILAEDGTLANRMGDADDRKRGLEALLDQQKVAERLIENYDTLIYRKEQAGDFSGVGLSQYEIDSITNAQHQSELLVDFLAAVRENINAVADNKWFNLEGEKDRVQNTISFIEENLK